MSLNDFDIIKERTRIEQFIPSIIQGETSGSGETLGVNPCPICGHKDCFKIFKNKQLYKCFSCDSGGDIFNFIQDYFKLMDWHEVLKRASELTGVALQNPDDIKTKSPRLKQHQEIFNYAAEYYNKKLQADPEALKILSNTRKYTTKTIKEFKIGFTGDTWDGFYQYCRKNTFSNIPALLASGLIKKNNNKFRDAFGPGLFVFPHFVGKHVKDFSCKDAFKHKKKKGDTKYNPRLQTEYRIGDVYFYNQDAVFHKDIIIVEGQHDAIQLMRNLGTKNVMATTGMPHEKQLAWLKKHVSGKDIYLAFDYDAPKGEDLSAGDKYRRKVFLELWPKANSVKVMVWDNAKDVDEYLRTLKKEGTNNEQPGS